jgi:hypothetical protein
MKTLIYKKHIIVLNPETIQIFRGKDLIQENAIYFNNKQRSLKEAKEIVKSQQNKKLSIYV